MYRCLNTLQTEYPLTAEIGKVKNTEDGGERNQLLLSHVETQQTTKDRRATSTYIGRNS